MNYATLQSLIDKGKGKAADHVGQPYNVYRINAASTGDYVSASNLIASDVPLLRRTGTVGKLGAETVTRSGVIWYEMVGNIAGFLVGDVWIQDDPVYGEGSSSVDFCTDQFNGLALASHLPAKKTIGGRLDRYVHIYRPSASPIGSPGQQLWDPMLEAAMPVILCKGCFYPSDTAKAKPSAIPAGFQDYPRPRGPEMFSPQVKGQVPRTLYYVYIPCLPGFEIMEGDRIVEVCGERVRYVVINPYRQDTGATGYQLLVERELKERQ